MKQGWEIKKIKDICDKASSNIAQNKITELDGDYPVYGASGFVQNVDFYHRDTEYIGIVKDGSGVGRVNTYPANSSLLGTLQYIIPKEGYALNYVAYALKSLNLAEYASGAAIPHIYFKDYGEETIPVPPREEQERIVAELDCLSGVIEKKKQQLKELDALAQSIFYEMFGNPDVVNKDWEDSRLEDLCIVITKGTTPTTLGYKFTEAGINFLKVESFFKDGTIDIDKVVYISNECHEVLKRSSLQEDDILLCIAGATVGRLAKVPKHIVPANTNQAFAIIRLKEEKKDLFQYIYSYLHSPFIQNIVTELKKGVAQPNLTLGQVRNFKIVIPPKEIRISFVEKIGLIENEKKLIKKSIEEVEMLFNSRMDYYFG